MNTDGGTLYVGVRDDGRVCGIESDLEALRNSAPETVLRGPNLDTGGIIRLVIWTNTS